MTGRHGFVSVGFMKLKQSICVGSFPARLLVSGLAFLFLLMLAGTVLAGDEFTLDTARAAATNNDAHAEYFLARCYARGLDVPQDDAQAADWLHQAADHGYAPAQNDLGAFYAHGRGVKQDYAEAARWYRKAAEQGDALAEYSLGRSLLEGRGVSTNVMEGLQWYQKAVAQNQPDALLSLGNLYLNGAPGIPVDCQAAAGWFERAAAQGNSNALNSLGFIYENGCGSSPSADIVKALHYYRAAAEKNDAKGQMNLGRVYLEGIGVKADPVEAYKWFYLAQRNGEGIASHYLKILNGNDPFSDKPLAQEKIAEAVQQANDFLKDHP
jgi:hypothetical protein